MDDFLLRDVTDEPIEKFGVAAHAKRTEPDLTLAWSQLSQQRTHQGGLSGTARP